MARTARQKAATRALVALNRGGQAVRRAATRTRTIVRTIRAAPVRIVQAGRMSRRRSVRIATAVGVQGVALGKIAPGVAGGYGVGMLEQDQRRRHAVGIASAAKKSGALIADPTTRLAAEALALAFVASRTSGFVRDAAIGASGAIGALYRLYSANDGSNPDDNYIAKVKAGETGV